MSQFLHVKKIHLKVQEVNLKAAITDKLVFEFIKNKIKVDKQPNLSRADQTIPLKREFRLITSPLPLDKIRIMCQNQAS